MIGNKTTHKIMDYLGEETPKIIVVCQSCRVEP